MLQWLALSYHPMKLDEVVEVLAIDFDVDPPKFDIDNRFPDPSDLLHICGSLVTHTASGELELAHFSVKEYLMSHVSESVKCYAIDAQLSHTCIAQTCLSDLLQFTRPVCEAKPRLY